MIARVANGMMVSCRVAVGTGDGASCAVVCSGAGLHNTVIISIEGIFMANGHDAPSVLTVFTVEQLIKYMGDDAAGRATISKIVRDAIAPGSAPVAAAGAAIREEQYDAAGHILHGLRGSIGSLGCQRFVAASMALEQAIAERRVADMAPLFAVAEAEYGAALAQAATWLALNEAA
jgi:HPt (histidine-containing phosphotransfer) domain-containing protein